MERGRERGGRERRGRGEERSEEKRCNNTISDTKN